MKKNAIILITGLWLSCFISVVRGQGIKDSVLSLRSPDKNITFRFRQKVEAGKRTMHYSVDYKNKPVILESVLDLQLDNDLSEKAMALKVDQHKNWCENLLITGVYSSRHDTTWAPVTGERAMISDHYNAMNITLVKDDNPIYVMQVQVRVYNEGVAFRYYFPENPKGTYYNIRAENTEFHLPEGTQAWFANWAQAPYYKLPLKNWPGESERPLTIELPNGLFAALGKHN
ncbi:glycoside hydrolase family 97 N-terminal domain-containing protein [Mucilaginibacter metallidurans]|uniref:glycoside hydrolase family 97 N-terminal domain-containing protein n=1 Tax=Mucilaginibacter sp. P4 TaxID=3383180 RepID=UPI001AD625C7|nr:glycoside hydrolase family 97 N-terminal domain-containing protein [Mucilaginibacter gossypii]